MGGVPAQPDENKNLIAIQVWRLDRYKTICGGTIITQFWVLTSGFCIYLFESLSDPLEDVLLLAGAINMREQSENMQYLRIVEFIKHENYLFVRGIVLNDLGMIKADQPGFIENDNVAIYPLSQSADYPTGFTKLIGWGGLHTKNIDGRDYPDTLQSLPAEFINSTTCRNLFNLEYRRRHWEMFDFASMAEQFICTGPLTKGHSMCSGDYGGPLVQEISNGSFQVVAIQSRKVGKCGRVNTPAIHSNVAYYKEWIISVQEEYI